MFLVRIMKLQILLLRLVPGMSVDKNIMESLVLE